MTVFNKIVVEIFTIYEPIQYEGVGFSGRIGGQKYFPAYNLFFLLAFVHMRVQYACLTVNLNSDLIGFDSVIVYGNS